MISVTKMSPGVNNAILICYVTVINNNSNDSTVSKIKIYPTHNVTV